jgi:hypothetical protein
MPTLRYIGGPKPIYRPRTRTEYAPGDVFEVTDLWLRQHQPFWLAGYFEEVEVEAPKSKKTKKTT